MHGFSIYMNLKLASAHQHRKIWRSCPPSFVMFAFVVNSILFSFSNIQAVNLLADIGGQLGLWIGISALTCCEVLELVLMLVQRMFRKMKNKRRKMETAF